MQSLCELAGKAGERTATVHPHRTLGTLEEVYSVTHEELTDECISIEEAVQTLHAHLPELPSVVLRTNRLYRYPPTTARELVGILPRDHPSSSTPRSEQRRCSKTSARRAIVWRPWS